MVHFMLRGETNSPAVGVLRLNACDWAAMYESSFLISYDEPNEALLPEPGDEGPDALICAPARRFRVEL
jgi:hypothetical protein